MGHHDYTLHRLYDEVARQAAMVGSVNAHWASAFASMWGMRPLSSHFKAAAGLLKEGAQTFPKPDWGLNSVVIGGRTVPLTLEVVDDRPMMELIRFRRDGIVRNDPKVLIVAPMSGHYATLLRGTVERMAQHHDVYVTDWKNPRDVSMKHGSFGFDDYVRYVGSAIDKIGPDVHVMAVCQPTVPVMAAVALMAQDDMANQPLSMTLIAGPIDTRVAPTDVTKLAEDKSMSFFKSLITTVPHGYPGAGRHVYPGFMQLQAFMAMNPERHLQSRFDLFNHLRRGDGESAEGINKFYREYLAVMDMTEEFYLQTIDRVFQRQLLAKGELIIGNQLVAPSTITRTSLLTIEGGKDDICALGQTRAAHDVCTGLSESQKRHYVNNKVGHYGTFSGRTWRDEISREIEEHIRNADVDNRLKYSRIPPNSGPMPPTLVAVNGALIAPPAA